MKKNVMYLMVCFVLLSLGSFAQLKVNSSGKVGVGDTTPSTTYDLKVKGSTNFLTGNGSGLIIDNTGYSGYPVIYNGSLIGKSNNSFLYVYSNNFVDPSDFRQKENIRDLKNSLDLILQLNGVKYDYLRESVFLNSIRGNGENSDKLDAARKNRVGFIAQDVEKVIPEVVSYDEETDLYGIDLSKFTPYLVEAIKEQQAEIVELRNEIANCCKNNLKSGTLSGTTEYEGVASEIKLYQNNPNPFSNETTIRFEIPQTIQSVQLHICNMTGTLLKTITINQRGSGNEIISGNEFTAGMYLYSLVCDGKIVDTKQMLLTE